MQNSAVLSACRNMLGPIVRMLLRAGISFREFAALAKDCYVDTARRDYGLQGRPTNLARVSMMTGLSRREVSEIRTRLESGQSPAPAPASRISHVLSAWHLDPEFTDIDGRPALLPAAPGPRSLPALLDRYAGDLPHGAFVKELLKLGLMEKADGGYRALARDYVRSASDPDLLRQAGISLADHGTTIAHNVDGQRHSPARFERMATRIDLDVRHIGEFHRFIQSEGQALLEKVDAWLAAHAANKDDQDRETVRAGLGMYLIQDDTTRG